MLKILLPVQLNPISRRKDKSVKLSFETRELQSDETLTLMSLEGAEMWLCLAPNQDDIEIPEEEAHVEGKTESERLRAVLFVLFKQETGAGRYTGLYDIFRKEYMEKIIQFVKNKLEN